MTFFSFIEFYFYHLSGATCPPLLSYTNNPITNALQLLLNNSALLFQQQNLCMIFLFLHKCYNSLPVSLKSTLLNTNTYR